MRRGRSVRPLSAGVSRQQVEDALAVCAAFNTTARLADVFGFELLSPEGFETGAKVLLKRGYRWCCPRRAPDTAVMTA